MQKLEKFGAQDEAYYPKRMNVNNFLLILMEKFGYSKCCYKCGEPLKLGQEIMTWKNRIFCIGCFEFTYRKHGFGVIQKQWQ